MKKILLYEEYDKAIHGNQNYIILLSKWSNKSKRLKIEIITGSKRALFKRVKIYTPTHSLDKTSLILKITSLIKFIAGKKIDAVMGNNERSVLVFGLAALINRVPLIWYIKNSRKALWSDLIAGFFAKKILYIAPATVDIKHQFFKKLYNSKLAYQPLGVVLNDFLEIAPPSIVSGKLKVLMLASISPAKGIDMAIEAMKIIDKKKGSIELSIAGATPAGQEGFKKEMKKSSGLFKYARINWLGWRRDIINLIKEHQLLILPSKSEGVPRSIIEVMASGRPAIATRVGGVPSIIEDGVTGFLIDKGDAQALANKLFFFYNHPGKCIEMGDKGRVYAKKNHSFDTHWDLLINHLEEVM